MAVEISVRVKVWCVLSEEEAVRWVLTGNVRSLSEFIFSIIGNYFLSGRESRNPHAIIGEPATRLPNVGGRCGISLLLGEKSL